MCNIHGGAILSVCVCVHGMDYGIEQDTVKYWHVVGCLLPRKSLFHMRWLSINFQLDVIWFLRINYALFLSVINFSVSLLKPRWFVCSFE